MKILLKPNAFLMETGTPLALKKENTDLQIDNLAFQTLTGPKLLIHLSGVTLIRN